MRTLFFIVILIAVLAYLSHTTITLKPFSIKFESLWSAIGYILIIIGCAFIQIQGYKDGLKKSRATEIIFDFERESLKH